MSPISRRKKPKKQKGPLANLLELIVTVAVAVGLALLIQAFLIKPYQIPSGSMIPTLTIGQRILVDRLDTHPALGSVVVFHPPVNANTQSCLNSSQGPDAESSGGKLQACDSSSETPSSQTFVKRLVGLPGDHLVIRGGYVYRNGKKETGSYVNLSSCSGNSECNMPKQITVPAGEYYMMGDNRGNSDDSRYWGPVPQKDIIGKAVFTYWPIDRIGFF